MRKSHWLLIALAMALLICLAVVSYLLSAYEMSTDLSEIFTLGMMAGIATGVTFTTCGFVFVNLIKEKDHV